jgi:methylthioxylose transferase
MLELRAPRVSVERASLRALGVWATLIVVAIVWGRVLVERGQALDLAAPPFWSAFDPHPSLRLVPALVVGGCVAKCGVRVARGLSWRALLATSAASSAVWAVSVAYVDGRDALTDPVRFHRNDYAQTAREIGSLRSFLSGFVDNMATFPQHSKGHPPGMIVIEWALDRVGLAAAGWSAALVVAGGAAAVVAALVAARDVAGEAFARTAAPFCVLVPAVIWWQTADAFFAGVSAWAITLVVLASSRRGRAAVLYAAAGGVLFGVTAFLSYGLVLLAIIPVVVCVARRRERLLVVAGAGALPVFVWFGAQGFSWFAGLAGTRHEYWTGVAIHRPYSYFLIANLALFAMATGPALALALPLVRGRALLLIGGIAGVVLLADLSGMSKAEVERIWLPFVPWAMLATGALLTRPVRELRAGLLMQVACTVVIAVTVWSQW